MTRALLAIGVAVLSMAQTALPQQPVRDPSAQTAIGTAVLAGQVVSDDSSARPMRRATVNLNGANLRGGRVEMTDDQGRFVFTALPPGRFTVSASKPAYLTANYNTTGIRGTSSPINLVAGQQLAVTLKMTRGAVITGIIRDANGQPLSGVRVLASLLKQQAGQRTITSTRSSGSGSDERGMYRIYGLAPGEYFVAAASQANAPSPVVTDEEVQWARQQAAIGGGRAAGVATAPPPPGPMMGSASVYYPGTPLLAGAVTVTLAAGEERPGIDFPLPTVRLAKIEGMLIDPTGRPAPPASITLVMPEVLGNGSSLPASFPTSVRSAADGKFSFQRVPPGRYTLQVRIAGRPAGMPLAMPAPIPGVPFAPASPATYARPDVATSSVAVPTLWASVDVSVNGTDVGNVGITLQPGVKVSGRIAFDGTQPPPGDFARARVTLSPVSSTNFTTSLPAAPIAADGTFTLDGATPGRYRLTATMPGTPGQAAPWTLKSAIVNGRDILDFPLEIDRSDIANVVVAFADRQTEISGTLFDAANAPVTDYSVMLFTVDRTFWAPPTRRVRSVRPGPDGHFRAAGLPPGEYYMMALADGTDIDWADPAFLDQLSKAAFKIALADGEKKTQDLKLAR